MSEYLGKHAIVIGASLAGLATARVLHDYYETVTLVERDKLPDTPDVRAGVPQARHVHMLLKKGEQILEELFPSLVAELVSAGATPLRWASDLRWYHLGGFRVRSDWDFSTVTMSRWTLEWCVRRRVAALPRVRIVDEATITGLLTNAERTRVMGVKLRRSSRGGDATEEPREERADLVVDASGRTSKVPAWLSELGYTSPEESRVKVTCGYASRLFRRPAEPRPDWKVLALFPVSLERRLLGMLIPIESGEWLCSLGGANGDYPPTDDEGFLAFARRLSTTDIYEAIKDAEPASPVYSWRRMDNQRLHYERLGQFPDGLVVVGDAVCSFNPLFAQGITMAVLGAKALGELLRDEAARAPKPDLTGFPLRFFARLDKPVTQAWFTATSEDLRYPDTEGPKLPFAVKLAQAYVDRVTVSAANSQEAYRTLVEVINMTRPTSALFRPSVMWQALRRRRQTPDGPGSPAR